MAAVQQAPVQVGMNGDIIGAGVSQILIAQEFAVLELCDCEAKNRYRISQPVDGDKEGPNIFLYIDEDSECCERICCSVNRSLTLNVHHGATKDGPIVQSMRKPFHCQNCCCCRPKFEVYAGPQGTNFIGTVRDPCRCCAMDQRVFDASDRELFSTYGSICQCGLCCPCCCSVDFDVLKNGNKVGSISKRPLTCCEMLKRTNRFLVDFGEIKDPIEKRMLLASAMLADLEYFEQNKNDNN